MITDSKPLNEGQEKAAEGFFNFLFSAEPEMIVSGPGGVGKTFLMGHLIDTIMPRYHESCQVFGLDPIYQSVVMTATTNKATEVLGKSIRRPTSTVHSFFKLVVKDNYDTGVSSLARSKDWKVYRNLILFVDECSMIDFPLMKHIQEGTIQCKIVYIGDHCQLAPVKEKISPIYRRNLPFFELTQPMRNADQPALMAACSQLRQTVETGEFKPIRVVPGVIDLLDGPAMAREIEAHFKDPSNHDRILAYTNQRVIDYNDHIRHLRGLPPTLTVGERVVNNSAIKMGDSMMRVEDEFAITEVSSPTLREVSPGVDIEVVYCTLNGAHGTFTMVPVPTDHEYFIKLMKYYAKQSDWRPYYELKNNYPDLRPRDAATVHKAQGSTYETVFLDLEDLSTCKDPATAARLLYVAFTRARRRVVMYGKLAAKFGGVVA